MPEAGMEGRLIDEFRSEIRGMRDDFRKVSVDISALATEVRHLTESHQKIETHGERLKAAETEIANIKGDLQSAATERRWIIGVLVAGGLALIGTIVTTILKFIH